jgi:hypothetical protein
VALAIDHNLRRELSALLHLRVSQPLRALPSPRRHIVHFCRFLLRRELEATSISRSLGMRQLGRVEINIPQTRTKTSCRGDLGKVKKEKRISHTPADRVAAGCFLTVMMVDDRSSAFLCVLKIGLVQSAGPKSARTDWDRVEVHERATTFCLRQ